MFTASRISKKTFFAAAALGLAAALPAVADLTPTITHKGDSVSCDFDGYVYEGNFGLLANGGMINFTKTGTGSLITDLLSAGGSLYNLHYAWYDPGSDKNSGAAYYTLVRLNSNGTVTDNEANYIPGWVGEPSSQKMLEWTSGEVRVEGGILNLTGYVNAWFDFGPLFNDYFDKPVTTGPQQQQHPGYGTAGGKMTGVTRITVDSGAVLDVARNNNNGKDSVFGYMVTRNYQTIFQYLHNLQAGDYGNAQTATLRLGDSPSLHLNIHIDGWDENTRTRKTDGTYLDNALAFGGSVGVLDGSGAVYKTGGGDLVLLNSSAGFVGELYAAGGELTFAANDSAGLGVYSFKDAKGNVAWKAKISAGYSSAESVNIAGTYRDKGDNGESRLGSAVRYDEHNVVTKADKDTTTYYYSVKESYFTTPEAGTLVIAENQQIRNFQSYFNAGYKVNPGTTESRAVLAAGNAEITYNRNGIAAESLVAAAPIIAGTGTGGKLVIPGGNYKLDAAGNWELQTNASGEMIGGVLLINQEEGMGGIYEGSIVGCRVTIYDRAKFNENTESSKTNANPGTSENRLSAVKVDESGLKSALTEIYGNASKYADLKVAADGSFALDNETAWAVVNYYKEKTVNSTETNGKFSEAFYVDYQADATVTGGILALDGKGDLALLLEQANFSGINIAATRTGKTVLNIAALNALPGSVVALGGSVSVVSSQADTLETKLSFNEGTRLIFTTGETISTVVRESNGYNAWDKITPGGNTILVGDLRKSVVAFKHVQDDVRGDVYVERGMDLDLAGTESIFPNASSLVLWQGESPEESHAASSLSLKGSSTDKSKTYVQVINNLTGDSTARIDLGSGVLIANITDNEEDTRSGLIRGTFNGVIRGEGSVVKGGSGTLTLGGGDRNIYTGTTEVGSGTLNVSGANGISHSSALILNAGTSVVMADGQSLRNLFGAENSSISVGTTGANGAFTAGALIVGSNAAIESGDNRPLLMNNLGTANSGDYFRDNSFARFEGNYDREGNLTTGPGSASGISQSEATQAYLTETAKLAYSGFDASVLEQFVGVKNYDGKELVSQADYEKALAYGKNQTGTVSVSGIALTEGGLLGELAKIYQELKTDKFYLDNIKKTNGYYDPAGLLRGFFSSEAEYRAYVESNGLTNPTGETEIQQAATNKTRFEKIVSEYERLSGIAREESLEKAFTSEAAARAKFASDFGSVKNLGGTTLVDSYTKAEALNTTLADFGIALEACAVLEKKLLNPDLTTNEKDALIKELEDLEKEIYEDSGLLDDIVGYYEELAKLKATIEAKSQFAGIAIAGAFAGDVSVGGELVSSDWVDDLAYAGTLTVSSLTKVGDNTLTLTGTLNAQQIVAEAGTLAVNLSALPSTLPGGITVGLNANLSVDVASGEHTFNYAVSGDGNFVKTGAGTLVLPDSVIYTGTTTIADGVLQLTLREPLIQDDGSFLAVQKNISITGTGAGLILDQSDDIDWAYGINSSADDVFVKKIGEGSLAINGNVALTGENSALTVSGGKLKLAGKTEIGDNAYFTVEKGATLAVAELSGTAASSVALRGSGAFEVVAAAGKSVSMTGAGITSQTPVPANGQGLTWDAFYGTVSVNSGTLSLSGESLFDYARGVIVASGATLSVENGSTQKLNMVAGSGNISLAGTLDIENNGGARLGWDWISTKSYIFDEGKLLDAPTFTGEVSGTGTLKISGRGLTGFTGTLKSAVSIAEGGQVVLEAKNAKSIQDAGKKITVDGSTTRYEDANGKTIVGGYTPNAVATNYSSGVVASVPAFCTGSTYVPRTFTASYKDAAGNAVAVSPENIEKDTASGKLIDKVSRREVSLSVTEWDYVDGGKLSANWTVFDAAGKPVDLSKTPGAIVWSAAEGKFVLGSYTDQNEQKQSYKGGFRWLVESENEDGSVSLVFADMTAVKSEKLTSELIFSAEAGTSGAVALSSGLIEFKNGGLLGKVGDGVLSLNGSDLTSDCGGVNVYEGELKLTGGAWDLTETNAARVALGATLTVELDGSEQPNFETVYGSGTLKLTTAEGKSATLAISKSSNGLSILPTYNKNGKFFNGVMSFDGDFDVSISEVEMSAVNTSKDVKLTLDDGLTLVQTQNTEILGDLVVSGAVMVKGESAAAGYATGDAARRLSVLGSSFDIQAPDGTLTLQNVGFGYKAGENVNVIIDHKSVANTFYYTQESGTINPTTNGLIDLSSNSKPGSGSDAPALKSLSMVMSGGATRTISGATLSTELGSVSDTETKDSVFSVSDAVYSQLAYRDGTFNIGVEGGILEISDWDKFTGTTAETANGKAVNIEFLSLRSNVAGMAGTIKITGENGASARVLGANYGTLFKTIVGGGNVEFADPTGTLVTAKQEYLGLTTVSGKAHFTGAGEENHSSEFTVLGNAEMIGGLKLAGRNISVVGSATRNMNDAGAAGTTTLKLELSDPRLPKNITVQVEIDALGNLSSKRVYAETTLEAYGIKAELGDAVKDGKLEVTITDSAYGSAGEYSVSLPVDINTFPSKVGASIPYAAPAIPVATTFDLQNGAVWTADVTDGDGVSASKVKLDGTIKLLGLTDAAALGKNVVLVSAEEISRGTTVGSAAVADALRAGTPERDVMIYTDSYGNVNLRVINDDFAIEGVDYNKGISESFLEALAERAGSAKATGGVLNADNAPDDQNKELLFALNSISAENLKQEVERLSPSLFASMLAMPVAAFNSDAARIHERLNQRRYDGADPLRETGEYEFFALAQSDFAENGNDSEAPTFDYSLYGVTAGYDWKPNYETTLGFALGYTYGDAKGHGNGGKVKMDDMRITAFASRLIENFYIDAGVQAGMAMFDSKRHTIAGTSSGDTDSVFAGTFITVGSIFTLSQNKKEGSGLYFSPSIGLSYFRTGIDGFSETGIAGLKTDDAEGDSLRARIAASLQWQFPLETWNVRLGVEAAYTHDFLGEELDTDGRFAVGSSTFSTSAGALPTDIFSFGPTVDIMVSERTSLYFGYGIEVDTDSGVSQNINAGFRHRF